MTALVSILNKKAAVIAADSAVTISKDGKTRIYNTANKIFRLSDTKPIGVMIYDSSQFMQTPWDVLFKLYRERRSNRSFDTLKEYADDFLGFLKSEKHCNSAENQWDCLTSAISSHYYKVQENARQECKEALEDNPDADAQQLFNERIMENILLSNEAFAENGVCPDFENYSLRQFKSYAKERFNELVDLCKEEGVPGTREEWEKNIYNYIRSQILYTETGIVFVGYGDDDIFPSLIHVHVGGIIDGHLMYYYDEGEAISYDNDASIQPFAQTDTMISLMKGIHPTMYETLLGKLDDALGSAKQKMMDSLAEAGMSETQMTKVNEMNFDDIAEKFHSEMRDYIQDTFVDGIVDAVGSFNIEDMVKMAESLISITNLQRHFSSSEESVGGPVDVAVITKSEGFVWVNHKQWFQQDMNPQMMERR